MLKILLPVDGSENALRAVDYVISLAKEVGPVGVLVVNVQEAPMVYGVKLAYAVVIPLMIGGLGLQILLHLWRLMVNR